jgi:hypothetical protein
MVCSFLCFFFPSFFSMGQPGRGMPPHHWNPNMNWSAPGGPPQAHQPMRAPPASTSQMHTGRWRCSMFLFLASNTTTISLLSPCSSVNLLLLSSLELSNSRRCVRRCICTTATAFTSELVSGPTHRTSRFDCCYSGCSAASPRSTDLQ